MWEYKDVKLEDVYTKNEIDAANDLYSLMVAYVAENPDKGMSDVSQFYEDSIAALAKKYNVNEDTIVLLYNKKFIRKIGTIKQEPYT